MSRLAANYLSNFQVIAQGAVSAQLRIVIEESSEAFSAIVGRNGVTSVSRYDGPLLVGCTGRGRAAIFSTEF